MGADYRTFSISQLECRAAEFSVNCTIPFREWYWIAFMQFEANSVLPTPVRKRPLLISIGYLKSDSATCFGNTRFSTAIGKHHAKLMQRPGLTLLLQSQENDVQGQDHCRFCITSIEAHGLVPARKARAFVLLNLRFQRPIL